MPTAIELEEKLQQLIGKFPGFGHKNDGVATFEMIMKPYLRQRNLLIQRDEFEHLYNKAVVEASELIKQWMIAKGIDPKVAFGYPTGSLTLQNAFKGGNAYLKAIKDNPRNQNRGFDKRPTPRGVEPVDIDLDLLNEPGVGNETPMPVPQGPQQINISATQIRDAIASIANPQIGELLRVTKEDIRVTLNNAASDFEPAMNLKIEEEVAKLKLGQQMTAEITRIAEIAARNLAESMLPRRVEIKNRDKIVELDREPRHEAFEEILEWLLVGCHVYVVGPKGTGKTHMGTQARDALRIAFKRDDYEVFFIDQSLTKYDVKGYKGPTGEYVETLVRRCVEVGGLLFIDEGDTWAPAALAALNSILANSFGSFPDKVVEVHKDFRCILAANTYGTGADRQYTARNPLDAASLDRFSFVVMDYDRKMEAQLFGNGPWTQYVWRVRDACTQLKREDIMPSMRAIAAGNDAIANGMDIDMVARGRLWKGYAPDIVAKIKEIAGEPPRQRQPIREVA